MNNGVPEIFSKWPAAGLLGSNTPALHPAAAAALRRHRAGTPERRELLARTAVFLARIEDSPFITTAHVEAAAAITHGNDLGCTADALEEDGPEIDPAMVHEFVPPAPPAMAVGKLPITLPFRHVTGLRLGVALTGLVLVGGAVWLVAWPNPPSPPETQAISPALPLAPPPPASVAPAVLAPVAPPPVVPSPARPLQHPTRPRSRRRMPTSWPRRRRGQRRAPRSVQPRRIVA